MTCCRDHRNPPEAEIALVAVLCVLVAGLLMISGSCSLSVSQTPNAEEPR